MGERADRERASASWGAPSAWRYTITRREFRICQSSGAN